MSCVDVDHNRFWLNATSMRLLETWKISLEIDRLRFGILRRSTRRVDARHNDKIDNFQETHDHNCMHRVVAIAAVQLWVSADSYFCVKRGSAQFTMHGSLETRFFGFCKWIMGKWKWADNNAMLLTVLVECSSLNLICNERRRPKAANWIAITWKSDDDRLENENKLHQKEPMFSWKRKRVPLFGVFCRSQNRFFAHSSHDGSS